MFGRLLGKLLLGNDGLTWCERRRLAREYAEMLRQGDEWRAQRIAERRRAGHEPH